MLDYCGRTWLRHGPVYTVSMIALSLGVSLNILSIIDLLCLFGILNHPFQGAGPGHPQRYLYSLLYIAFIANSLLARHQFGTDHAGMRRPDGHRARLYATQANWLSAPAYLLGSAGVFLVLTIYLQNTN